MEQNRGHQCRPLLIAGRGAIATCSAHYGKPVGVTAAPQPGGH